MQTIPSIVTNRLELISLSVECLRFLLEGDHAAAQAVSEFIIPLDCSLMKQKWVEHRLRLIEADPEQHPWMYRAIVRKSDSIMVGSISFHHKAPDPDLLEHSDSAAELGYTIEPVYRQRGYAKESAVAMMEWAYHFHSVETFILCISPENVPSLKMAEAMNFKKISERMDEFDGLEFTFQATIAAIRQGTIPAANL